MDKRNKKFLLERLTKEMAQEICHWEYETPYDVYNHPAWEVLEKEEEDLVKKEKREKEFKSLLNGKKELCGFVQFDQIEDNKIRIKLGIKPQMTGMGIGKSFLKMVTEEAKERLPEGIVDLEVLTWNKRAIKVYKRSGFKIVETYERKTPTGKAKFYRMELEN